MKKLLFALMAIIALTSCGNSQNANAQGATKTNQKEYVEVLYFHGKQRCVTCNTIEKLTKEVIDKDFAQQLKDGKVVFKVIDISTKEGEKIADKYEVTWSSLFVNKWKDGKETKNNMTDFGFSYAKGSPDVFKEGVKKKVNEQLK
ncbi:nitrophenyl compound nitroreductase subunit ArsF family protein [Bacteroides neonati]|uniref:nitrophenyl compound nitroreductase subunit ArsF family protein n=1 Tax=Bacteroides neonati TaxID=1347393 RepID=UPI0004AFB73C|nr:nitrophenyl compound nitroreductase subunit ArsF family protein [Bacteroides neonati]